MLSSGILDPNDKKLAAADVRLQIDNATVVVRRMERTVFEQELKEGAEHYRFDLCLTPRPDNITACYADRWGGHRVEPLGRFFIIPPGEKLTLSYDDSNDNNDVPHTAVSCFMSPDLFTKWFEGELDWPSWRLEKALHINEMSMQASFKMVAREVLNPVFSSVNMLEFLVPQLAVLASRYLSQNENEQIKGGLAVWRLRLIEERVKEIGKAPTLEELAAVCKLSSRQLSRGFRVSRGCSIGTYIEQVRFESAKRLILDGEHIKHVARQMGYASQSSFSQAFRRATGMTPSNFQYRG